MSPLAINVSATVVVASPSELTATINLSVPSALSQRMWVLLSFFVFSTILEFGAAEEPKANGCSIVNLLEFVLAFQMVPTVELFSMISFAVISKRPVLVLSERLIVSADRLMSPVPFGSIRMSAFEAVVILWPFRSRSPPS